MRRRNLLKAGLVSTSSRVLIGATGFTFVTAARSEAHLYTIFPEERDQASKNYYHQEGILGFIVSPFIVANKNDKESMIKFPAPAPGLAPLYRSYKTVSGGHFYTTNMAEWQHAIQNFGHRAEGIAGWVPASSNFVPRRTLFIKSALASDVGNQKPIPIYRLHRQQDDNHFYTSDAAERDRAVSQHGYNDEGLAGYCYSQGPSDVDPHTGGRLVPFYRLLLPLQGGAVEGGGGHINWRKIGEKSFEVLRDAALIAGAVFTMDGLSNGQTKVYQGDDGSINFERPIK